MSAAEAWGLAAYVVAGVIVGVLFARDMAGTYEWGRGYPHPAEVGVAFIAAAVLWPFVAAYVVLAGLGKLLSIGVNR